MEHFEDLADRLDALLRKRGWTQKDLHNRSGVAASQISDYLNPKKRSYPTLPTLGRLLDALGATREDLFSLPVETPAAPLGIEGRLEKLEEQFSYLETRLSAIGLDVDRRLRAIEECDDRARSHDGQDT